MPIAEEVSCMSSAGDFMATDALLPWYDQV